jgi:hypothetical protein
MDNASLSQIGFSPWRTFGPGVEREAPEKPGIYVFRSKRPIPLDRGESDIMYIGRAQSTRSGPYHHLGHALREYLYPGRTQGTKQRVGRKAREQEWEVAWMEHESPDQAECSLLQQFHRDHGQLPPENKRWPPHCRPL